MFSYFKDIPIEMQKKEEKKKEKKIKKCVFKHVKKK